MADQPVQSIYATTRYPGVVHIVDPNVAARTCCKRQVGWYVPKELADRLGVCITCRQAMAAMTEASPQEAQS